MAKYEATFHARTGGQQKETFEADSSAEAMKKAVRYRSSFGSSARASFNRITIKRIDG